MKIIQDYPKIVAQYGSVKSIPIMGYKIIWKLITRIYKIYLRRYTCIKKDIVVFESEPDYADNARALCEYMVNSTEYSNLILYFVVRNAKNFHKQFLTTKIHFIGGNRYGELPLSTLKILYSAEFIFSSHSFTIDKSERARGQKYIRLWHGCGYKDRIAVDKDGGRQFDKVVVPGPLFVPIKARYWDIAEERIIACGYPRYDWLMQKTARAIALKKAFQENGSAIIMWMPTYRNAATSWHKKNEKISSFPLLNYESDWQELDNFCKELGVILVLKLHVYQIKLDVDFKEFTNIRLVNNEDFDMAKVPMYEFLAVTDALISDYSSVAVDYLIVNKPIAYTLDDYEQYKKRRGFVFEDPRVYMPGHHLYTLSDLKTFLQDVISENDIHRVERERMMGLAISKSECYCKALLQSIHF